MFHFAFACEFAAFPRVTSAANSRCGRRRRPETIQIEPKTSLPPPLFACSVTLPIGIPVFNLWTHPVNNPIRISTERCHVHGATGGSVLLPLVSNLRYQRAQLPLTDPKHVPQS